ncbi:hypothetical protein MNEG_3882 [Monoraphidium neglectum]|uniref:Thioredoxin domain-containing protein n=1 Tax=Monoraphidium neglectum TaxID=145388 RepID=A0A0D2NGB8_9CHLO|nr:hypothetical protein MNEG_3882 [Monoraphidium neglectum]KIZ04081.1 hypothetical protein MNEG_3882 [Monoraphidium neglectum]|eukprot:XP_013903100.1 hypothetical protein MNEG_3882 [Monoraphidium neglectum]
MSCAAAVPSGSEAYAKLYPEKSSDGVLRLGNVVPDFEADSTLGPIKWHDWIDGEWPGRARKWAILFSHPADFTPVCTTEIGRMAIKYKNFEAKGVKVAALSCDKIDDHNTWLKDVVAHCANKVRCWRASNGSPAAAVAAAAAAVAAVTIDFPILADPTREIATLYGMLDPALEDKSEQQGAAQEAEAALGGVVGGGPPMVFIIGPDKKLKLTVNYPASVGRNMDEIERVVDALILSSDKSIATPANWPNNHEEAGMKGWVFLLPTVTKEDADKFFPDHKVCDVPSKIEYLRLTPVDGLDPKPEANATVEAEA